jgi:iron complex outermembrane recepter protein
MKKSITKAALLLGAATVSMPAFAQSAAPAAADTAASPSVDGADIVVTATRRETRLQTTPAAITALNAAELRTRGITDVQSLTLSTPGMSFGSTTMAQAHIAIRGIGSDTTTIGQDPRVAFYEDGVYIGRPTSQLGGVFDLERIEVLKGPQGALYGRNATGGAVNVLTAKPTRDLAGYARISYGNYNAVTADGAVGDAVGPNLSVRLAGHFEHHDGYGKNITTGGDVDNKNAFGLRASVLWEPTTNLSFLTTADYSREKDRAYGLHYFGPANPAFAVLGLKLGGQALTGTHDVASNVTPQAWLRSWGITETIKLNSGDVDLQSITAYRYTKNRIRSDFDGTSLPLFEETNNETAKQFSQELTANGSSGALDWLVGGLYYHENIEMATVGPISNGVRGGSVTDIRQGLATGGRLQTDAISPYFELAYHLNDAIAVRAGGRYTYEQKHVNDISQSIDFARAYSPANPIINAAGFPRDATVDYRNFVPSATIEWKATPNIFAYAKYSQGFKSGNFNISVNQAPFQPEKIKSYEVGLKTTIPDLNATFNLTGFYYDYTNLQVSVVRVITVIENAASARVKGVEAEARIEPIPGLTLSGAATYLDAKYRQFATINPAFTALGVQNLAGKRMTQAPELSLNGSIQERIPMGDGNLTARVEANYTSRVYFTPFDERAISQSGYTLANANLRYDSGHHWSVEAFIRNIGDKQAVAQAVAAASFFGFPVIGTMIPPRTFGIRFGYEL